MRIVLILLLLKTSLGVAQKKYLKEYWPSLTSSFMAGSFEGTAESLKFQYADFKRMFPNAREQYWNPTLSWRNKYRDGRPELGPKFFGSTSMFVWTTDGYHSMRFGRNISLVTTLALHKNKGKKLKHYLIDAALHTTAYQLGFFATYDLMFNGIKKW